MLKIVALLCCLAAVPRAHGIKCFRGAYVPPTPEVPSLSGLSSRLKADCEHDNRCMNAKFTLSTALLPRAPPIKVNMSIGQCVQAMACPFMTCGLLNTTIDQMLSQTGIQMSISACNIDCCEGDFCNKVEEEVVPRLHGTGDKEQTVFNPNCTFEAFDPAEKNCDYTMTNWQSSIQLINSIYSFTISPTKGAQNAKFTSTDIPLPFVEYCLTFQYKTDLSDAINLEFTDVNNNKKTWFYLPSTLPLNQWNKIELQLTPTTIGTPAESADKWNALVQWSFVNTNVQSDVYIDDIFLEEKACTNPTSYTSDTVLRCLSGEWSESPLTGPLPQQTKQEMACTSSTEKCFISRISAVAFGTTVTMNSGRCMEPSLCQSVSCSNSMPALTGMNITACNMGCCDDSDLCNTPSIFTPSPAVTDPSEETCRIKKKKHDSCCGKRSYNSDKVACCKGSREAKIYKKGKKDCCNGILFKTGKRICVDGILTKRQKKKINASSSEP